MIVDAGLVALPALAPGVAALGAVSCQMPSSMKRSIIALASRRVRFWGMVTNPWVLVMPECWRWRRVGRAICFAVAVSLAVVCVAVVAPASPRA